MEAEAGPVCHQVASQAPGHFCRFDKVPFARPIELMGSELGPSCVALQQRVALDVTLMAENLSGHAVVQQEALLPEAQMRFIQVQQVVPQQL